MSFDPEHFASVLASSMSDAVIYADAEGLIRFWNKGAERIFGFDAAEALGRSLDIIIPEGFRRA
jgi:PAS domain S-box-containing protein